MDNRTFDVPYTKEHVRHGHLTEPLIGYARQESGGQVAQPRAFGEGNGVTSA